MTNAEKRKIRARSMLTAKGFLQRDRESQDQRARYRYSRTPSLMKKTKRLDDMSTNEVIDQNNPNNPMNRTTGIGEI